MRCIACSVIVLRVDVMDWCSLRRSIAALHAAAAERYEDEKYHDEID